VCGVLCACHKKTFCSFTRETELSLLRRRREPEGGGDDYIRTRTIFLLPISPAAISTFPRATPNSSARNSTSAVFAFPSSGAAAMSILIVPSAITDLICVLRAPGCTRTENVRVPSLSRFARIDWMIVCINSQYSIPCPAKFASANGVGSIYVTFSLRHFSISP